MIYYLAVQPPSTNILEPVIKDEASEAKKTNGPIRSFTSPSLHKGIIPIVVFLNSSSFKNGSVIGV